MNIPFADIVVNKVRKKSGIRFSTDADIIYNGQILHTVTMQAGEQCEIRKDTDTVTVKVNIIWGY